MLIELRDFQIHLEKHFSDLRERRASSPSGRPIFGLEHGLDLSEIELLSQTLRAWIAKRPPSRDHALAWVVYSSEIGYRYSGDEYWQTFESETPGWIPNGDRYFIRNCFWKFQREFGGAEPSGAWAEHFTLICWPITHAILPKDLQIQLARILFELRHSYSGEILETPALLGELIAARSWNASSRFRNLTQETQLLSQIATALLFQGEFETDKLIYPATLKRISQDLDRERRAREWLRGARRSAKGRITVRGLQFSKPETSHLSHLEQARADVVSLGIEPRLLLRPADLTGFSWKVLLEIPDLSHLLTRFPDTEATLTGSRCSITGSNGRPLARGRLLHGTQRVTLTRWPRSDEVLLRFEQQDSQLDYLFRTDCLLRPGPTWLFRVAKDGLAYECKGMRVRPGQSYILASAIEPVRSRRHTRPIDLLCDGFHGAILELPQSLNVDWEQSLRRLELNQSRTIEVWPAGLGAVEWDGEGYGEWLASERPYLGVVADYPVGSIDISISNDVRSGLELKLLEPGEPVFIELPQLKVGMHHVRFSIHGDVAGQADQLDDLEITVRIREPRSWSPGINPHGPFLVEMDPRVSTLEQLWQGQTEIFVRGPSGRRVSCNGSLFERDGDSAVFSKEIGSFKLPVTSDEWRTCFDKQFQSIRSAQNAYDIARICEIEFNADELGLQTIRCEREFMPLRWILRRKSSHAAVHLLDDSGYSNSPEVFRMAFETPSKKEILQLDTTYRVHNLGGMYVARTGTFTAQIIALPFRLRSLSALGCVPRVEILNRSIESIVRLVKVSQLWGHAKLPGDILSRGRQRTVIRTLADEIARLLCGHNWAKAERALARGQYKSVQSLIGRIPPDPKMAGMSALLFREIATLSCSTPTDRSRRLASVAVSFGILSSDSNTISPMKMTEDRQYCTTAKPPEWISELALRIASDPANVECWAGQYWRSGLGFLLETPILAKVARFVVIAIDQYLGRSQFGDLYNGWRWS